MEKFDDEVLALLGQYRDALPDREPNADFMPKLWAKIDAKRGTAFCIRRLTRIFVTSAAALCLVMSGYSYFADPSLHDLSDKPELASNWTDVLAAAHPRESLASLGILRETSEVNNK
jgi:hypothetical protein